MLIPRGGKCGGKYLFNRGAYFLPSWINSTLDLAWGSWQFKGSKTDQGPGCQFRKQWGYLHPSGPPPPALSDRKEEQTDCGENGRQSVGVGHHAQRHCTPPGRASPPRGSSQVNLNGPLYCLLPKSTKKHFLGKGCYWTPETNLVKWLLCLRPFAGLPSFLGQIQTSV